MPNTGGAFSGGAGAAMSAFTLSGGNPFITAGAGLVGAIAGAFEPSAEDYFQELQRNLRQRRLERRREAIQGINQHTSAEQASARQAGIERARAAGRGGFAEAFIAPLEGQVADAGAKAIRSTLEGIDREYDSYQNQAEMNRPREAGLSDYLLPVGESLLNYKLGSDYIDALNTDESPYPTTSRRRPFGP